MLAFSGSSAYIKPPFFRGEIEELLLDEINNLRTDHHCFGERLPDFTCNCSARRLFTACLDSWMAEIDVLRICLNLCQSERLSVLLVLRKAFLRFRMSCFICDVIQDGSDDQALSQQVPQSNKVTYLPCGNPNQHAHPRRLIRLLAGQLRQVLVPKLTHSSKQMPGSLCTGLQAD